MFIPCSLPTDAQASAVWRVFFCPAFSLWTADSFIVQLLRRCSLHSPWNALLVPLPISRVCKGGTTGLFGSTAVVLRAGRNYEAGEEFFVSYGPKGAAGYLEENGCALAEVTCCYCSIAALGPWVPPTCTLGVNFPS